MSISENIKRLRTEQGLSQAEFGKIAGVTDKAVSTWELGEKTPRMGAVEKIAAYFRIPKSAILDDLQLDVPQGFEPPPKTYKAPLIGDIACGTPILAEQNILDYVDVPEGTRCDFCLRCKGDSMIEAHIQDGDVVYIRRQPEVEDGEIAAVRIGNEATLKRVYYDGESLTLQPCNSSYRAKIYQGQELEEVQIEGKMVGFTHWVK